ncbi:hypothetical protein X798_05452 [Onchocerca flexuosa]|uniref:Uncharacterized protein n=2 Tax=Onchocerca flexuosa TaxID=387005 RepID=A0A183HRG0_9BILA|nr:hypothetical protein X798_05452 [Onchocerca flexuosa]VDO65625.1 unnamed protein product [Onchocerca flexuosa]
MIYDLPFLIIRWENTEEIANLWEQCTSRSLNDAAVLSSQQCTNHESTLSTPRFASDASKENFTTKLYNYWSADWNIFRFTSSQS